MNANTPDAPAEHKAHAPRRVRFALLTVSDSRGASDDRSGDTLRDFALAAGHDVVARGLVRDDVEAIRASVRDFLARDDVDVLLTTGGTGVSPRDVTPEAIAPLLEKPLPGFGELFRMLSWQEVGSAAMASRAGAGTVHGRLVVYLPGSPKACRLAMERLVLPEAAHLVGLLRPDRRV